MRKLRKSAAADQIVAATAGKDSWKTFAGRNHGTDDFEVLDLSRDEAFVSSQVFG
jgi:hypothetical protein